MSMLVTVMSSLGTGNSRTSLILTNVFACEGATSGRRAERNDDGDRRDERGTGRREQRDVHRGDERRIRSLRDWRVQLARDRIGALDLRHELAGEAGDIDVARVGSGEELPSTAIAIAPPTSRERSLSADPTPYSAGGSASVMALVAGVIAAPMPTPSTVRPAAISQ